MSAAWTVMVYLAGNNSLSKAAGEDLDDMRRAAPSPDLNVFAFVKQKRPVRKAYRLQLVGGRDDEMEQLGDVDSGDPKTVLDFFRWAVAHGPARRYAAVLWNHGGGWEPDDLEQLYRVGRARPARLAPRELDRRATQTATAKALFTSTAAEILSQPTEGERQICNDDGTGHSLDTVELGNIVRALAKDLRHPVDLVGMDACLMSTLEVAYELGSSARVVVGSEDEEPGAGWPYEKILTKLGADPAGDARALGATIVDAYIDSYRDDRSEWPVTQAAVDLKRAEAFAAALDGLQVAISRTLARRWQDVIRAQVRAAQFDGALVDLKTFAAGLATDPPSAAVGTAAKKLLAALAPGGYVIDEGHLGRKVRDCGGISVYFPAPGSPISKYYRDLRFAKRHRWDDFLARYHRTVRGN